jgi:hypothetical protein
MISATATPTKSLAFALMPLSGHRAAWPLAKLASSCPLLGLLLPFSQDFLPTSALRGLLSFANLNALIVFGETTSDEVIDPITLCHG